MADSHTANSTIATVEKYLLLFLDEIEKNRNKAAARLANELFKHYKSNGENSVQFKLIPGRFAKEFETELIAANMPFMMIPDNRGNMAVIARDIDADAFLELQERVFKAHTEYYMENTVDEMLDRESKTQTQVMKMEFDSKDDFDIFRKKAYENGHGYVYSAEEADGKYIVYASMKDSFSLDGKEDIPSTILRAEADKLGPTANAKSLQLAYDRRVQEGAFSKIRASEPFVIANSKNPSAPYVHFDGQMLTYWKMNSKTNQFEQTKAPLMIPKDWNNQLEVDCFRTAMAIYTQTIYNNQLMQLSDHREHLSKDKDTLKEENYEATKRAFLAFSRKRDDETIEDVVLKCGTRPVFDKAFKEAYSADALDRQNKITIAKKNISYKLKSMRSEEVTHIQPIKTRLLEIQKEMQEKTVELNTAKTGLVQDREALGRLQAQMDDMIKQGADSGEISGMKAQIDANVLVISEKEARIPTLSAEIDALKNEAIPLAKDVKIFEKKRDNLKFTYSELDRERKQLSQEVSDLSRNVQYKLYRDKAIESIIEKAHTNVKQAGAASMTPSERTNALEKAIEEVIQMKLTPEVKDFDDFCGKNGLDGELDSLVKNVRESNRDKVNPVYIKDVVQERELKREREREKERRKEKDRDDDFAERGFD